MGERSAVIRRLVAAAGLVVVLGSCTTPPGMGGTTTSTTSTTTSTTTSVSTTTSTASTTTTTTTSPPGTPRYELRITSAPGDPINSGRDNAWTDRPASAYTVRADAAGITIRFDPGLGASWNLRFAAPDGDQLIAGPYESAEGYFFGSPTRPGLSISGNGVACNDSTGRFDVLTIEQGPEGVQQFAARFSQRCAGATGGLVGEIHVGSIAPFPPPTDTDVDGVPDSADNCRTAANPSQQDADLDRLGDRCDTTFNHTWLRFDSEPGDFIGQGVSRTWHGVDGTFAARVLTNRPGSVEVAVDAGLTNWTLVFLSPDGSPLVPGSYPNAARAIPSPPAGVPGLSVYGSGRNCNTITGSFVVHEVSRGTGGEVERFSADFVQHCDGSSSALRGSIRYDASRA